MVANCDHLSSLKFSKTCPYAFTEHGALMAANVLNSPQAVKMSVHVVRAFIQQRELLLAHSGSGAKRPLKTMMMSRYACYLAIPNADPDKEIVAQGQTCFAIQTRGQELSDADAENHLRSLPAKVPPLRCNKFFSKCLPLKSRG